MNKKKASRTLASDYRQMPKSKGAPAFFAIKRLMIVDVIYFYTFKDIYFTKRHDSFTCSQFKGKFVAYRPFPIGFFPATAWKFCLV